MRRDPLRHAPLFIALLSCTGLRAHEGMWLPTLLQAIEGDMRTEGLVISAEDIYSLNNGSIKDAVVLFGGGCTAEVVSTQGLILTNHHCGFGAIQRHSSLEHDYLKNGFWAATLADELPNPGLTATFIVRMEDVTTRVLAGVRPGMGEEERAAAIDAAAAEVAAEAKGSDGYSATVKPFNYGNSWYLIVSETYRDVRLVGAPPGSIGNFGAADDTVAIHCTSAWTELGLKNVLHTVSEATGARGVRWHHADGKGADASRMRRQRLRAHDTLVAHVHDDLRSSRSASTLAQEHGP